MPRPKSHTGFFWRYPWAAPLIILVIDLLLLPGACSAANTLADKHDAYCKSLGQRTTWTDCKP